MSGAQRPNSQEYQICTAHRSFDTLETGWGQGSVENFMGQGSLLSQARGRAGQGVHPVMNYLILIELQQPESPKVLERGADGGGTLQQVLGQL